MTATNKEQIDPDRPTSNIEDVQENFGAWCEANGIQLGNHLTQLDNGKQAFTNCLVDLNTLKAAVLNYSESQRSELLQQILGELPKEKQDGQYLSMYIYDYVQDGNLDDLCEYVADKSSDWGFNHALSQVKAVINKKLEER